VEWTKQSRGYLFSGLLFCGLCGFNLVIVSKSGDHPTYGYPGHRKRAVYKNDVTIRHDRIESQILKAISERVLRSDLLEHTVDYVAEKLQYELIQRRERVAHLGQHVSKLRAEMSRLQSSAKNLVNRKEARKEDWPIEAMISVIPTYSSSHRSAF
jgi:hypothetical protein